MKIDKLEVGDIIKFGDGDVGVVYRVGRTFLHDHLYVQIQYFIKYDNSICVETTTYCYPQEIEGKLIGKLEQEQKYD